MKILFSTVFFILTQYSIGQQKENKVNRTHYTNKNIYDIIIKRNHLEGTAAIYLYTNNVRTDSLKLKNLGFDFDTLINHNNTWWHYIFSECTTCIPLLESKFQFILFPYNRKLKLAFACDYLWTRKVPPGDLLFNQYKPKIDSSGIFTDIKKHTLS